MADISQPKSPSQSNGPSVDNTSASSDGSNGLGSDYVLPSSNDSSLVHISRDSSLMDGKKMQASQTSARNDTGGTTANSDVAASGGGNATMTSHPRDVGIDLSLGVGAGNSLKSEDFSLVSCHDSIPADVSLQGTGNGSCAASPESFIVLKRNPSEESVGSKSPLLDSCALPRNFKLNGVIDGFDDGEISTADAPTSPVKLNSTISNDSIVVLDHSDISDFTHSHKADTEEIPIQTPSSLGNTLDSAELQLDSPDLKLSANLEDPAFKAFATIPMKNSVGMSSVSHEGNESYVEVTNDKDKLDLVEDTGFDSLLQEKKNSSSGENHACNQAKSKKSLIEGIHAENLNEELSMEDHRADKDAEHGIDSSWKLLQQLPELVLDDPVHPVGNSSSPIKVFPPHKEFGAFGGEMTGTQSSMEQGKISSFLALESSQSEDLLLSHQHVRTSSGLSDLDTKRNSKEVWSDYSSSEKENIRLNNSDIQNFEVKLLQSESLSPTIGVLEPEDDYSMLESEAVIPGQTDSLVVHISETKQKTSTVSPIPMSDKTSMGTSVNDFSLLPLDTKTASDEVSQGHLGDTVEVQSSMKSSRADCLEESWGVVSDRWNVEQTTASQQQQSQLQQKLSAAFRHFQEQGFDLQNSSNVDAMISEVENLVRDIFVPSKAESINEEDLFTRSTDAVEEGHVAAIDESSSSDVTRSVELSEYQLRLLSFLDGQRIIEHEYGVKINIDQEALRFDITGTQDNVWSAEAVLGDNRWMKEYMVRVVKIDPEILELLQSKETRSWVDQELLCQFDFKFCWNVLAANNCILVYAKSQEHVDSIEDVVGKLICSADAQIPQGADVKDAWTRGLTMLCEEFPEKILTKVREPERQVCRIVCTQDISSTVEDFIRKLEQSSMSVEDVNSVIRPETEEQTTVAKQVLNDEAASSAAVGSEVPSHTKTMRMESEVFRFLSKWKMVELREVSSNQSVEIRIVNDDVAGFDLIGKMDSVELVCDYINNCVENVASKIHRINSEDLITFLQRDECRVMREVEERHKCCIDVEQKGVVPTPPGEDGLPTFAIGHVHVDTVCDDVYNTGTDVVVMATQSLEATPYGPSRFVFIENHKKKAVKVIVPTWNPDAGKQKSNFIDMLVEMFGDLKKYGVTSAAFPLQQFNGWPFGKLVKAVVQGLQVALGREDNPVLRQVVLCDMSGDVCRQVCNILRDALGDPVVRMERITLPRAKKRAEIKISVEKGEIAKQKVDVIVNTTSKTLDLGRGEVSKSILHRAGPGLQKQAKRYHPKGLAPGEIVATNGFSLDCKRVYHGALEPWPQAHASHMDKQKCKQVLETFILDCLHQADLSKYETIAFPALGTGVLEIPPKLVARTMVEVIKRFEANHPLTTVTDVRIIIYPKDFNLHRIFKETLADFEKESHTIQQTASQHAEVPGQSLGSSLPPLKRELLVNIGHIQLCAGLGDLTKQEGYDAVVMLWIDDSGFQHAQKTDNLMSSIGQPSNFKISERRQLITPAGHLPQRKILHIYVSEGNICDAFLHALILAEREGDIASLVFPLRVNDYLAQDYKSYTRYLYQAIERYLREDRERPSELMKVKICISGQHMVTPVLALLEELEKGRQEETVDETNAVVPLIVRVTATKSEVSSVISELENPPPSQQDVLDMEKNIQRSTSQDDSLTVTIPDIHPNIYEGFLYFYHDDIHRNLAAEFQMTYHKSENSVAVCGQRDLVRKKAEEIQRTLIKVKRDICIDIFDLPESTKASALEVVEQMQKDLKNVLLYVPDKTRDCFHIIGLDPKHVQTAKHKITNKIGLVSSRAGRKFEERMEECSTAQAGTNTGNGPIAIDNRTDVHTFIMPNGAQVYVYTENILQLPVDCIVNAANEELEHGGGVAKVISDAAGKAFDDECRSVVKKDGKVKVGTSCHTSAGRLNYRYVIHTVGPRWKPKKAEECRKFLNNAVSSCIVKAAELGMRAIGIPAISSGIFGGPVEECVQIYVQATMETCSRLGHKTSLKEIHFIDLDPSIVVYITSAFAAGTKDKKMSLPPTVEIAVDSTTADIKTATPLSDIEGVDIKVKVKYPKITKYSNSKTEIHEFELKQHFKVLVYTGDIVDSKANAIAFGQDKKLNHGGHIANKVKIRGGKEYKKKLKEAREKRQELNYGDVLVVDSGSSWEIICFFLEAITPTFSQQDLSESMCVRGIRSCNINLLHEAARIGLYSLAMPLLGTGSDLQQTEVMAAVLYEQVIQFFNDMGPDCKLKELHIVNKHDGPTLAVRDLFQDYVQRERRKLMEKWQGALGMDQLNRAGTFGVGTVDQEDRPWTSDVWEMDQQNRAGTFCVGALDQEDRPSTSSVSGIDQQEKPGTSSIGEMLVNIMSHCAVSHSSQQPAAGFSGTADVSGSSSFLAAQQQDLEEEDMEIDGETGDDDETTGTKEQASPVQQDTTRAVSGSETCAICIESVGQDCRVLEKCSHVFCRECIDHQFQHYKPVCPTCGTVYGVIKGNQPDGKMTISHNPNMHLPGYEQFGTYTVTYNFPGGIQGPEHPNPSVEYEGTLRSGYIPDCPQGKVVVDLLRIAFDRRLVFTIGHSRTTGCDNVVTWNDVHHKTNRTGGPQRFGYPDPHYLNRVMEELAAKGVTKADLQK